MRAPLGSKFFQFHAVFEKIWQNRMLAPPPRGNPGCATEPYGANDINVNSSVSMFEVSTDCTQATSICTLTPPVPDLN